MASRHFVGLARSALAVIALIDGLARASAEEFAETPRVRAPMQDRSFISGAEPAWSDGSVADPIGAEIDRAAAERNAVLPVTREELGNARSAQSTQLGGAAFDPALPLGVNGRIAFNYSALWEPSRSIQGQDADLGVIRQNSGFSFPLWFGDEQSLFASVGVQHLLFQTDAILPDSGQPFPSNLWDVRGNLVHIKRYRNNWSTVLIGSLGSTGDRPFAGASELIPGAVGALRVPSGDRNAWLWSVSYQPVTGLPYPIPGLAYVWEPSDRLTAQLGVPFQLYWQIFDKVRIDASYLPIKNVRAYATYQWSDTIEFFGGFDWINESYFLWDRVNSDDFFNLLEQRLPFGIRWCIGRNWVFDAQAGYVLNRVFFQGPSAAQQDFDVVNVDPGAFGMLRLLYRF